MGAAPTTIVDNNSVPLGTSTNPIYTAGSAAAPEVATIIGNQVTSTDKSGTITAGGTAQTLMAANSARRGWWIQNKSTGLLTVSGQATPSATVGMQLAPGQLYEAPFWGVTLTEIKVWGATTSQAFEAREW